MMVWKSMKLQDCLLPIKGKTKVQRGWSPQCLNHPVSSSDKWGVLKTTAVQMGRYEAIHNKELPSKLEPKVHFEVQPGDFLMTTTGPRNRCGVVCFVRSTPERLIFSGKILRFRVNEELVDPRWVEYLLLSPTFQTHLDALKVGTSDSSVSIGNEQILSLEIPVPPLHEQRSILEILDDHVSRLDKALAELHEAEHNIELLIESYRHDVVSGVYSQGIDGWRHARLGEIARWGSGGTPQSGNPKYYGGSIPWCVIGDLTESDVILTEKSITDEGLAASSAKIVQPGTVLLAMYGASIGRTGLAATPMATNQAIAFAVPNPEVDPRYLLLFLQSQKRKFVHAGKGGAQPNISQTIIKDWNITFPPVEEQRRLIQQVKEHQQSMAVLMEQNHRMKNQVLLLKKSLLNAAFTGALKV